MTEIQIKALERGVEIYNQLEAVKDDPDWLRFCELMELYEKRTDAVHPSTLKEFEEVVEERQAEERRVLEPSAAQQKEGKRIS